MMRLNLISVLAGMSLVSQAVSAAITFNDVSVQSGVAANATMTWGADWGDVDGDLHPDIFSANHQHNRAVLFEYQPDGTFLDVSDEVDASHINGWTGFRSEVDFHGTTFGDYDNDGDQDLLLGVSTEPDVLLENRGGLFYDISLEAGTDLGEIGTRQPLWLDFNRDGRLDLALIALARMAIYPQQTNGSFSRSTGVPISCPDNGSFANLADVASTPGLELVCGPGDGSWPGSVYGFQQNGTTTSVVDVTGSLPKVNAVNDVATGDFNGDLKPDIFLVLASERSSGVAQASARNVEATLFTAAGNVKSMTFRTAGVLSVRVDMRAGVDPSGDPALIDIGSIGWSPSSLSFTLDPADSRNWGLRTDALGLNIGYDPGQQTWTVYQRDPDGAAGGNYNYGWIGVGSTQNITNLQFIGATDADRPRPPKLLMSSSTGYVDRTSASGLGGSILCRSAAVADFDNDMDEDIYLACSGGAENIANILYQNNGNGTFTLVPNAGGAVGLIGAAVGSNAGTSDSVITADYDIDGYMDAFIANGLNLRPLFEGGPKQLFHNTGSGNHWLEFDLRGVQDNRDAIGAQVYVTAGGKTQYREQNGGYHRWSQNHMRIHVGLAGNTSATVRVVWPNGTEDTYAGVAADGLYRLTQGGGATLLVSGGGGGGNELEDACGEPAFSGATDRATFLWLDCDGSNRWHLRVTGGGTASSLTYEGTIESLGGVAGFTAYSLEASDVIDTASDPDVLSYVLTVWNNGVDGFDFTPSANACYTPIAPNLPVYLGVNRVPAATSTLNLSNLQACGGGTAVSVCGEPAFDSTADRGTFVWKDCNGGNQWHLRVTGGGTPTGIDYEGTVDSPGGLLSLVPVSVETHDVLDVSSDPDRLSYLLRIWNNGLDGIDFIPAAGGCFTPLGPALPVYVGAARTVLGTPDLDLDLETAATCN